LTGFFHPEEASFEGTCAKKASESEGEGQMIIEKTWKGYYVFKQEEIEMFVKLQY